MGAVEEMCVFQMGHSGNGCDLMSTLCKYDLRIWSELAKCVTSEAGKYLFRTANVWRRCAHYFVGETIELSRVFIFDDSLAQLEWRLTADILRGRFNGAVF